MFGREHFRNVEEFLGLEWLGEGCNKIDREITRQFESGVLDHTVEDSNHAVHKLWYNHILGKALPSDLLITGAYKTEHVLRQAHRLLVLEQLISKLRPTWDTSIADYVRSKLRNAPEFESTLFELLVLSNFREAGHDCHFRLPIEKPRIDIEGTIMRTLTHIECKRVTFRARPHISRLTELDSLAGDILGKIRKFDHSVAISIEFHDRAGPAEIDTVRSLFKEMGALPSWLHRTYYPGPWTVMIRSVKNGATQLTGDFDLYDVIKTDGAFILGSGVKQKLCAVGIIDHTPSNWGEKVRDSLNTARQQLMKGHCNIICLEVADMAYFTNPVEFERVFNAVEEFLLHDSKRVSAVILTFIGVVADSPNSEVKEGPVRFRSSGRSWLIRNPQPYAPLPPAFEAPSFDKPDVWVRASVSEKNGSPLQTEEEHA
ncbi:MAG: hypothetical protein HY666_03360 [Chloroflexi bacterium]|nr:hypothetical protein [Chloroflexota bacterium]